MTDNQFKLWIIICVLVIPFLSVMAVITFKAHVYCQEKRSSMSKLSEQKVDEDLEYIKKYVFSGRITIEDTSKVSSMTRVELDHMLRRILREELREILRENRILFFESILDSTEVKP